MMNLTEIFDHTRKGSSIGEKILPLILMRQKMKRVQKEITKILMGKNYAGEGQVNPTEKV